MPTLGANGKFCPATTCRKACDEEKKNPPHEKASHALGEWRLKSKYETDAKIGWPESGAAKTNETYVRHSQVSCAIALGA